MFGAAAEHGEELDFAGAGCQKGKNVKNDEKVTKFGKVEKFEKG